MIEIFFHLPPESTTPVVHLEMRISPQILEKIWNGPNGILKGLGETDSWKNHKLKISWHCPFKYILLGDITVGAQSIACAQSIAHSHIGDNICKKN